MSHRAIKSVSFSLSASLPVFFHIWIPIFKLWCWVSCIEEKFLRWQSFFGDNSYFQHSHQQHSLQLMVSKQRSLVGYSLWKESFVHPWPMPNCRHNLENWFRKQMWLQIGNKLQKSYRLSSYLGQIMIKFTGGLTWGYRIVACIIIRNMLESTADNLPTAG